MPVFDGLFLFLPSFLQQPQILFKCLFHRGILNTSNLQPFQFSYFFEFIFPFLSFVWQYKMAVQLGLARVKFGSQGGVAVM